MTEKEQIELAIRRARERINNLPVRNMDVIQALDLISEELTKIGRRRDGWPPQDT